MEEVVLTPDQVAQILQVHPFTVLKFIRQGKLKASKLGRVYRIRRKDVDAFLDEQAAQASESKGEKSKNTGKIKKVSPSKDISGDSSLTNESKEAPLTEEKKLPLPKKETIPQAVQETTTVTDHDEEEKPHRHQEDHYVIELKL